MRIPHLTGTGAKGRRMLLVRLPADSELPERLEWLGRRWSASRNDVMAEALRRGVKALEREREAEKDREVAA